MDVNKKELSVYNPNFTEFLLVTAFFICYTYKIDKNKHLKIMFGYHSSYHKTDYDRTGDLFAKDN